MDIIDIEKVEAEIGVTKKSVTVKDCQYPWTWLVISHNGSVKPCCWTGHSIGTVNEDLKSLWNNDLLQELRMYISQGRIHSTCKGSPCPYVQGTLLRSKKKHDLKKIIRFFLAFFFKNLLNRYKNTKQRAFLFDENRYLENYPDVLEDCSITGASAYTHFRLHGKREGRNAHFKVFDIDQNFIERFDEDWYLNKYPDISSAVKLKEISGGLEHFFMYGQYERREFYLRNKKADLNNYQASVIEYVNNKRSVSTKPSIITLEITTFCNIKCVMCPQGRGLINKPEHLSESVIDYISPFLDAETRLQISGIGEPLMSPLFWLVLQKSKKFPETHIRVNSNALLWNKKNIDIILNSNLAEVSFSLDASTNETYYKIRGADFNKVITNIQNLVLKRRELNLKKPVINLNMTLMRENIEEITGFIKLAKKLGVDKVRVWHLDSFGDDPDWEVTTKSAWIFKYSDQMLQDYPELSNRKLIEARELSNNLNIDFSFINDREILFFI